MPDQDGTSSNGTMLSGLPWWLRGLAIIGFPALAAAYLTWLMAQALPVRVDALQGKATEIYSLEKTHHDIFLQKWSGQDEINKELIGVIRATCVNAAKNEEARNRCLGR